MEEGIGVSGGEGERGLWIREWGSYGAGERSRRKRQEKGAGEREMGVIGRGGRDAWGNGNGSHWYRGEERPLEKENRAHGQWGRGSRDDKPFTVGFLERLPKPLFYNEFSICSSSLV